MLQFRYPMCVRLALTGALMFLSTRSAHAQLQTGGPADDFTMTTFVDGGDGLQTPTDVELLPDGRLVILQKGGNIAVRERNGTVRANAGRPPGTIDSKSEKGLLGVAVDPGFAQNKTLYFYVSVGDTANKHKVLKATIADNSSFTWASAPVIDMGLEGPANHDGGGIVIYKGQLYISVGDTGGNYTPPVNKYSSCLNKANGKILRVNLDGTIPSDNPLSALTEVTGCDVRSQPLDFYDSIVPAATQPDFSMKAPDKRIFAWGLRNPFRIWIDERTSRMWIGDVGEVTREEITVSAPVDKGWQGQHFGYPFVEGTVTYPGWNGWTPKTCSQMTPGRACTAPVFDYRHQGGDNCVIAGLIPHDGCGWPDAWKKKYFFGDNGTGRIYTLDVNSDASGITGTRATFASLGSDPGLSAFHLGWDGSLYVTADRANTVFKITPKNQPAACAVQAEPTDGGMPDAATDARRADAAGAGDTGGATDGSLATVGGQSDSGGAGVDSAGVDSAGVDSAGVDGGGSGGTGGRGDGSGAGGIADGSAGDGSGGSGTKRAGGGCGCTLSDSPGVGASALLIVVGAVLARPRRRRRS